jgi:hypothetical protein
MNSKCTHRVAGICVLCALAHVAPHTESVESEEHALRPSFAFIPAGEHAPDKESPDLARVGRFAIEYVSSGVAFTGYRGQFPAVRYTGSTGILKLE